MLYDSSDDEYEFNISPSTHSDSYTFPHVDSLKHVQGIGIMNMTLQTSDSIDVPNAPELERKTSPQRPKGLPNISLGLSQDRQAMREELTRLKCAAGLLPNE